MAAQKGRLEGIIGELSAWIAEAARSGGLNDPDDRQEKLWVQTEAKLKELKQGELAGCLLEFPQLLETTFDIGGDFPLDNRFTLEDCIREAIVNYVYDSTLLPELWTAGDEIDARLMAAEA